MRTLIVLALVGFLALSLAETETLEAGTANMETFAEDLLMEGDRMKRQDLSDDIFDQIDDALRVQPRPRPSPRPRVSVAALKRLLEALRRLSRLMPPSAISPMVSRMIQIMKLTGIDVAPLIKTLSRMGVKLSGDPTDDITVLENQMADPAKATDILAVIFKFIMDLIKEAEKRRAAPADFDAHLDQLDDFAADDLLEDPASPASILKLLPRRVRNRVVAYMRRFPRMSIRQVLRILGIRIPGFGDYADSLEDPFTETSEDPSYLFPIFTFPRRVYAAVRILDAADDEMITEMLKEPTMKKFILKFVGKIRANLSKKTTIVNISDQTAGSSTAGADAPETATN